MRPEGLEKLSACSLLLSRRSTSNADEEIEEKCFTIDDTRQKDVKVAMLAGEKQLSGCNILH